MKATDCMALAFKEVGLSHFFSVTGGAAVHLIDSLVRTGGLTPTFHNHEQAAAFAADSYARLTGLGLCVVTTGPGVTNCLTGTLCSWQDSIPTIFLSGQARRSNSAEGHRVRQAGTQHLDVRPIVSAITKQFYYVTDSNQIESVVAEASSVATSSRPGPVWIDFPLDQQIRSVESNTGKA